MPFPTPGHPRKTHWTCLPFGEFEFTTGEALTAADKEDTADGKLRSVSEEEFRQNPLIEPELEPKTEAEGFHLNIRRFNTAMDQNPTKRKTQKKKKRAYSSAEMRVFSVENSISFGEKRIDEVGNGGGLQMNHWIERERERGAWWSNEVLVGRNGFRT